MASAYPFSTTWTGAGDGTSWSDATNWSNGVPLTGANASGANQDIATIDNSIDTTPYTVVISGEQSVGEIDVDAADPTGGVAVSLTGELALSTSGGGFGLVDLTAGTFEIDGGTVGGGEVAQKGGTLAFGTDAKWGVDTLAAAIIDGTTAIDNASTVVIQQNNFAIFDGLGGYGTPAAVTISDGSTLSVLGSLYLDGEVDVKNGTLSLDGGNVQTWGGPGVLYADGGSINVTQTFSVDGAITIEGGLTFTGPETMYVSQGDALTLGSDALAKTVVNLDGGTIDVSGALSLDNTVLENGTVILESASTYTIDATSSLSGVTITDNRPAGQTSWTGAAGDDQWTNAANWTNGVPQSGVDITSASQSIGVINNVIDTVPSTIDISGTVNAQDIALSTNDPSNGESVSLTGTLDLSWNGEGVNMGNLTLNSGSFELDGGTLEYADVNIGNGTLAFDQNQPAQETLSNDTLRGNWSVNSSVVDLTGNDLVEAQFGGQTTVSLNNGAQLIDTSGTLSLDGAIDIQNSSAGTLFALDGGNLSGYNGDAATILVDDGTFAIDADTTFSNAVDIYGTGAMVYANSSSVITVTIDAGSVTTIGQTNGAETTVNLNGGTLDVFGTLTLTNTFIENGTINVESGAVFNQDSSDTLSNVTVAGAAPVVTVSNWTTGDGPIDNTNMTIDAGNTPFTLMVGETIIGGTILDPADDVTFAGGTLSGVTYQGPLDVSQEDVSLVIDSGLTVTASDGTGPGTITLESYQDSLTFDDTQTFDNATINLTDESDSIFTAVSAATFAAAGQVATPLTLTLGTGAIINSSGYYDIIGNPQGYDAAYGATTVVNNGTINVTSGTLEIDPSTFVNNGTITVANGATLDLEGNWSTPGTITVAAGATIELGGNYTDATLASLNQPGNTLEINGVLDNTGGTLDVGTGATYAELELLAGGTIKGGTISDAGGGIAFSGGTLDNVTYDGPIDVTQSGTTIYASDGLKLSGANGSGNGVIDLPYISDLVLFNDTQTLDNATINLSGGIDSISDLASAQAYQLAGDVDTSQTLTFGPDLTINQTAGYNYLGGLDPNNSALANLDFGTTTLVNDGVINVTAGTLVINPTTFINKGTIDVSSGATLFLDGNFTNLGTISLASGSTIDIGGSFTAATLAKFNQPGVTLEIGGALDNSGAILNVGSGQTYAQLTLENGGSIVGGTVNDSGGVAFNGGTLDGVTYNGDIDLASEYESFGIADGSVFNQADGTGPGSITLGAYDQTLNFYNSQTIDNVTINLTYEDSLQVVNDTPQASGSATPASTLVFGANATIDSTGKEFIFGGTGTVSITNDGTINVESGALNVEPTNFINNGTINVAAEADLYIYGNWQNNGTIVSNDGNVFLGGNFNDTQLSSITNDGGNIYITGLLDNTGDVLTIGQGTALPLLTFNGGQISDGTINDAGSGIALYGTGALNDITYEGALNLSGTGYYTYVGYYYYPEYNDPALYINNGLALTGANGTGPGQLNVTSAGLPLDFTGTQTFDNATVSLGSADSINAYTVYPYTLAANLTLGSHLIVNTSGGTSVASAADFGGAGTITSDGTINVVSGISVIDPASFSNIGTINVAAGATLYLEGDWSNAGTITLAAGASVYLQGSFNAASVANIVNNGGTIFAATIAAPDYAYLTQGFNAAIPGISLTDPGATSETVTLTDATGLLSATGSGVIGSGTTSLVVSGTTDQVNTALATLTDNDPVFGNDAITVSAVDGAGNSAAPQTITVSVTAPIYISVQGDQSVSQNTTTPLNFISVYEEGALSGADLTVTISDTTGTLSATGTGVSGSGTDLLTISGSTMLIAADLATVSIDEANPGTDTVTIGAQDAAGDMAQPRTFSISTTASPTASAPATEAVTQNAVTPLSGFSVSESGSPPYAYFTATLSDTSGLLSTTGATGPGAASITFNGTLAQVNADLATLTLDDPTAGPDTLNLTVTDSSGGTASQNVAITSTHVDAPDLTVSAITAPSSGIGGQTVQLTWTVTNSGDATATGPWTDNVYLATDAAGTSKTLVGSFTYTGTLAPGQSETETQTITIPAGLAVNSQTGNATTYFVVQTDANNQTGTLSGIQNNVTVATAPTAATQTINWTQVLDSIKPAGIDATDYALFEQRFIAEVGTTDASYSTAIANAIAALDKTTGTTATYSDAVGLLIQNAANALGDQQLAQIVDPSTDTTGLNGLLAPSTYSDATSRNNAGVFGDGWSSELNDVGPLGPMNGFDTYKLDQGNQAYIVTYITTYVDQYGDYLGQSTSYQVVAPASYGINFLDPSNPYSNYTQTNANGTVETFSGISGLLVAISDGNGNAIAINRNSAGVITSIKTISGHPPVFTVNAEGNITSATDSSGTTITYSYDATGTHLLSTTSSAGTESYQYATSGNAFIQNALTQVTNPDGTTQSYTYNAQGNIASQSVNGAAATTFAYSGSNTITRTDADGQAATYTFDANGLLTAITDADGNTSIVTHNANGNVASITTAAGQTYTYAYDASGNLTGITDPLGNTVLETYAAGTSDVATVTDQNGNLTQYQYTAAGQVSTVAQANGSGTQYKYNSAGQVSEKIEASGATIQYSYNAAGQVTSELFSDGTSQRYTYNAIGNLTSSTAVNGGVTTYAYDAQGLLASVTNAAGQIESYSYNVAGQETQRVEPDGSITNYTYTTAGKLAQITDGSGAIIATYTYDAAGALTGKTTGNGASTTYTYDASGNLAEIKTLASDGSTTSKTDYTYDADSRIATATSGDGTWTYTYDADNQLSHAVFASTNAAIASQDLTYEYDAAGNRTQTIFNGATTTYTTNNLNQYTSADGTTFGYDANGNLLTKVSGGNTTTYTYNVQNQLTSSTDASGTTTYTYDALGNIASQTVNGVLTSYVSDPLAINSTATGPLSAVAQAYNASGQATATYTYGNGLTAVTSSGTTSYYNADASGNITSLSGANGALTQTYAYTPTGTVLNSTGSMANPFQFNGLAGAITQANGLVNTRARYYDPTTGRFITQDPTGQSGGINLYTYADNNSINFIDANGDGFSPSQFLFGVAGLALTVAAAAAAVAAAPVAATVVAVGGAGTATYQFYKSLTKDGDGLYADTNAEVTSNVITTLYSAIPGESYLLSTAQFALSGISSTDLFDVNYAVDYYDRVFNNTVTVNVPRGGGHGDVHLTTFDGLHFDFQAVGEFVLAKSTALGDNFQVQVRLSALGGGESSPTFTTEIGIQVGNQTVTFGAGRAAIVWVDGVASALNTSANTLTLAGGTISQLSQNTYQVTEKTGEVVNITDDGGYFDYTVALAPSAKPGSVVGLLGSYTGTANAFQLPDGSALGASLTAAQLYQTFGNAWRITDATSLLNYGTGETTATYTDLNHPSYGLPVASLPAAVVQAATDAATAAGLTGTAASDAVYDYLATGDPSFIAAAATSGAAAPVTATAVITPSAPPPPSIGISPALPSVTELSGQTPVTFTVSLTSAATTDTVVDYTVSSAAIDAGKTYFDAADFGGTLPSGTVTILAGQSEAQFTLDIPDSALGSVPDKWLAVNISTPGADPIYAGTAQVDILNNAPVAGVAAQPVLEYVPGNVAGESQNAPTLTHTGNSYSLNLGNVAQGTSLAALQFALANMASAPADGLDAVVATALGSGFMENGLQSATVINAGGAYSQLYLQPLTTNLGTQSEVVTFAAQDVNATGYSSSVPQITLTVTENVIAAAQALINTTSINLPDARVGSTDSQTITVTNTAATGAAPLDVTLGAATGATASGSIAQLATGASDSTSLSVGLATTTAGLQTSFVTLDLASDLGNGVETPLALNQSVGLTGSVYRSAAAMIKQSATVVHVGDAGSQALTIVNDDPADGYSEGLRATVTGVTGNIVASGTTGLIAAGVTDASSIGVSYSTATAGVVSGQIDLGLTSDGTGVDTLTPISLGTNLIPFSVQVDNYATADLQETAGGGTMTGSAGAGYVLDLGTISQGAGPATIDLAALNSASGLADLLSGSFGITGDSAFTNSGFDTFSGLSAGQADPALSVSLSTVNDGTFSETITLSAAGSNASGYSGAVAPVTLTIEGTVASDTPVLAGGTVVTGAITEQPGTTGSASLDTVQGSIAFTDANLSSTHAASVVSVAATGVTTGLPGNSALLALLSLGTLSEDTASTPGSVAWDFAAADSTFDYLAAGETLTLTYAVSIAQVGGKSATQDVTVTVTGTNDLPVIASGTTPSASITAIVAGTTTPADDTASGTILFTDADLSDTHTATIASVTSSGTVAGLPSNATLLALLATTAVTEQAGATPGSVGWNFTAPDATFAYLAPGQSVTLVYAVDVSDNHGGTVVQDVSVTVTGAAGTATHYATAGTILGTAYASYDDVNTASGFLSLQTFYDGSGNVVATESYGTNGGHTITIGGVVIQTRTVNSDGSYDIVNAIAGTVLGSAYASVDNAYTASGVLDLQTFYGASGNVVATETPVAGGGFDIQHFVAGTFEGHAYASYVNAFNSADFVDLRTFYDASGAVVGSESFETNGGHTITLGGVVIQVRTVNSDGSYDIRNASTGTVLGSAYASVDNAYSAAGVLGLQTFYDTSGNVVATVTRHADGSFDVQHFVAGTFEGQAYASYVNAFNSADFVDLQTYYNAASAIVGSESFLTNGGYTITVDGAVTRTRTVNPDGSYDLRIYTGGTVLGSTYASVDNAYDTTGFLDLQTFYDASGAVVATETPIAGGGFDIQHFVAGTFKGQAYASYVNAFSAANFVDLRTFYDASGDVIGSESFQTNGSHTITLGGVVIQVKTVNADGSYLVENDHVTGQPYTQSDLAYTASATQIALGETLTGGTSATTLTAAGLTLSVAAGIESLSNGAETFQLGANTGGTLDIAGAANATLAYGTGDGAQIISGFATSGAGADVLSFSTAVFADYAHLLGATKQQGSDLLITLDANDTLLLKNVSMSSFTSSNAHFT